MIDCRLKKNKNSSQCIVVLRGNKLSTKQKKKFSTFKNRVAELEPKTQRELDASMILITADLIRIERARYG